MRSDIIVSVAVSAFLLYGVFTYPIYRIGSKFGVGSYWAYWVPVYNFVLLCRCASFPSWYVVWLLIPVTSPGLWVYLWGSIARRLGHSFWPYGLGSLVVGLPILILAFDGSSPNPNEESRSRTEPWEHRSARPRWIASRMESLTPKIRASVTPRRLYCVLGEFAGQQVEVQETAIVIGRDVNQANLILSSPLVSATHVRVSQDLSGRGLLVEDLNSTNGTYYLEPGWHGGRSQWTELRDSKLLAKGARFRLGEDAAEFEII